MILGEVLPKITEPVHDVLDSIRSGARSLFELELMTGRSRTPIRRAVACLIRHRYVAGSTRKRTLAITKRGRAVLTFPPVDGRIKRTCAEVRDLVRQALATARGPALTTELTKLSYVRHETVQLHLGQLLELGQVETDGERWWLAA